MSELAAIWFMPKYLQKSVMYLIKLPVFYILDQWQQKQFIWSNLFMQHEAN